MSLESLVEARIAGALMKLGWAPVHETARSVPFALSLSEFERCFRRLNPKATALQFEQTLKKFAALSAAPMRSANYQMRSFLLGGLDTRQLSGAEAEARDHLRLIDYGRPEENSYTFDLSSAARAFNPDLVLYVNGLPVAIIEVMARFKDVHGAIDQLIQRVTGEPQLWSPVQLLILASDDEAKYGTLFSAPESWTEWPHDPSVFRNTDFGHEPLAYEYLFHALLKPERLLNYLSGSDRRQDTSVAPQPHHIEASDRGVDWIMRQGSAPVASILQALGTGRMLTVSLLIRKLVDRGWQWLIVFVTSRRHLEEQMFDRLRDDPWINLRRTPSPYDLVAAWNSDGTPVILTTSSKLRRALSIRGAEEHFSRRIAFLLDESGFVPGYGIHRTILRAFPNASVLRLASHRNQIKEEPLYSYDLKSAFRDHVLLPVEIAKDELALRVQAKLAPALAGVRSSRERLQIFGRALGEHLVAAKRRDQSVRGLVLVRSRTQGYLLRDAIEVAMGLKTEIFSPAVGQEQLLPECDIVFARLPDLARIQFSGRINIYTDDRATEEELAQLSFLLARRSPEQFKAIVVDLPNRLSLVDLETKSSMFVLGAGGKVRSAGAHARFLHQVLMRMFQEAKTRDVSQAAGVLQSRSARSQFNEYFVDLLNIESGGGPVAGEVLEDLKWLARVRSAAQKQFGSAELSDQGLVRIIKENELPSYG